MDTRPTCMLILAVFLEVFGCSVVRAYHRRNNKGKIDALVANKRGQIAALDVNERDSDRTRPVERYDNRS